MHIHSIKKPLFHSTVWGASSDQLRIFNLGGTGMHMPQCMCNPQRTTLGGWFLPSTLSMRHSLSCLFFCVAYSSSACEILGDALASISHLSMGELGLQLHLTISEFLGGSGYQAWTELHHLSNLSGALMKILIAEPGLPEGGIIWSVGGCFLPTWVPAALRGSKPSNRSLCNFRVCRPATWLQT